MLCIFLFFILFYRLEPLLARIKEKRSAVLCPIIDHISAETLAYSGDSYPANIGGFWWSLHFRWDPIPKEDDNTDPTKPIRFENWLVGFFKIVSYVKVLYINKKLSFKVFVFQALIVVTF